MYDFIRTDAIVGDTACDNKRRAAGGRAYAPSRSNVRRWAAALAATLSAISLAGCGGGGGGSSHGGGSLDDSIILGKVISADGNPAPGTQVAVEDAFPHTTSLAGGSFRLTQAPAGIETLLARATINGIHYSGSTQVLAIPHATTSNADIMLSRDDSQATVYGTVLDNGGHAINQARVFLANTNASSGNVSSLVAFTDHNGHFAIYDIPAGVAQYTLTASVLGYQNYTQTVTGLASGEQRTIATIHLNGSSNQSVNTPTGVSAQAFTTPSASPQAQVLKAHSAQDIASAYEAIRRLASPRYATWVTSAPHSVRAAAHAKSSAAFGDYAIETDVFFDESQRNSLSGFRIYSSEGSAAVTPYDFLQDPLANLYIDLDPGYLPNHTYNFAVSAVNTDGTETALSTPVSVVVPLQRIYLDRPAAFGQYSNPIQVAWTTAAGTQYYSIFLYNQFPSIQATPIQSVRNLPATQTSYSFAALPVGSYWVVVAATADNGDETSLTQITPFSVR